MTHAPPSRWIRTGVLALGSAIAGAAVMAFAQMPGSDFDAAMAEAMMAAHYPLQALLYAVATRRHLARRVPDYDPTRDFAGVGYLFVRGMAGPKTPLVDGMPCGVFTWHPSDDLVVAASTVLAGGRP